MIQSKQQLHEWLEAELPQYGPRHKNPFYAVTERAILRKHSILLRKTEYHKNVRHRLRHLFYSFRLHRLQNRHALHIPLNVCGKGLKVMHLGPVLIHKDARIGQNCTLHMNTSIVAHGRSGDAPVLGDGIVVGVGAVVLGGVTLADHIAIGANAVVNRSFEEEDIAIAGVPAKKISDHGRLSWSSKKGTQDSLNR